MSRSRPNPDRLHPQARESCLSEVPSHDPDAEVVTLAGIVARPERVVDCGLLPSDFYLPECRYTFEAVLELLEQGRSVEFLLLKDALERRRRFDQIGDARFRQLLYGTTGNFKGAVKLVKEHSVRRKCFQAALNLLDAANDLSRTPEELFRFARAAVEVAEGLELRRGLEKAFRFLPLNELLSAPSPIEWLIRGYLEARCLAAIIGVPGCMKTFLALAIGLAIASGKSWYGHSVPNPGSVFYIAGEGFEGLKKRIQAWMIAEEVDQTKTPFFVSEAPAQFLNAAYAREVSDAVEALVEQHGSPRLIIVDTLNRNFGPGDENSSQDMTAFVAALDALRTRFGCAILVVHHSGLQDEGRGRGSSVLRAALDFEYILAAKGGFKVLSCSKCKDHEPSQPLAFEPETVRLPGWTDPETMETMTSCVLRQVDLAERAGGEGRGLCKRDKIALEALAKMVEASGVAMPLEDWREAAIQGGLSSNDERKMQTQDFRRAKQSLQERGLVQMQGDLWTPSGNGITGITRHQRSHMKPGEQGFNQLHPPLEGEAVMPSMMAVACAGEVKPDNHFEEVANG